MYKVVGRGTFNTEDLVEFLNSMGITNPLKVIKEATENRRAKCGEIRILAFNM